MPIKSVAGRPGRSAETPCNQAIALTNLAIGAY
jgi:hypothetical protein